MGGVTPAVRALAAAAGLGPVRAVSPIAGGANNRVFRVETDSRVTLLKSYFRHPDDPRDRLGAEWAFARFAWDHGVRCIPEPLAADPAAGLALFEFVRGKPLAAADQSAVERALEFFRTLNRSKADPAAAELSRASESCFSLDDHLATISRRVERLRSVSVANVVDAAALAFVESELVPAWERVRAGARAAAIAHGLQPAQPLAPADRCLSPSDFGFHNALLADDGRLRFLDFEYAGWDDPAKLVCDFFCQPAVPAPAAAFGPFASAVAAEFADPAPHLARSTLLLPVYRVKWVCIMLNEFLPVGRSRRAFSHPAELEARKANQLAKARAALAAVPVPSVPPRKVA